MGILLFLVVVPPFLVGSVYPWAFAGIEGLVLAALLVWMLQVIMGRVELPRLAGSGLSGAIAPVLLFASIAALQLIPLPPVLLKALSPATYDIYEHSLPGWPATPPYSSLTDETAKSDEASAISQRLVRTEDISAESPNRPAAASIWRTVSLAPSRTQVAALKFSAMAILLALVTFYPFASPHFNEGNEWFVQRLVGGMLVAGFALAAVGLLQRETWNGKLLWLITPYSDLTAGGDSLRARGPFVDPDHFASYLGMIMPLAIVGTLWPHIVVKPRSTYGFRLFSGFTAALLATAMLMSMSRGALVGSLVSLAVLLLALFRSKTLHRDVTIVSLKKILFPLLTASMVIALGVALAGTLSRGQVDLRWHARNGSSEVSRDSRPHVWWDTLKLVREFPVTGVGLGCYGEIFAHYQRAPWSPFVWDSAHDDYLQLAVETGIPGLMMLVAAGLIVGHRIAATLARLPLKNVLLLAGLVAGLSEPLFHELVDFPLQIPANATLFAIMLGATLRMTMFGGAPRITDRRINQVVASGVSGVALFLIIQACRQGCVPFPYNVNVPANEGEARQLILKYPARAQTHLWLIRAGGNQLAVADKLRESKTAAWLDPTSPFANDVEAGLLLQTGQTTDGLTALSHSIWMAPSLTYHSYLSQRASIVALGLSEQGAIASGFKEAVASDYVGAVPAYGSYLDALGKFSDEAALYNEAGERETVRNRKASLFIQAGEAYAAGQQLASAENAFERALIAAPADAGSYVQLCNLVYGPLRQPKRAEEAIHAGIEAGADSFSLYQALADVYEQAGDTALAVTRLQKALDFKPSDAGANALLARLYLREHDPEKAVDAMRQAAEVDSGSAARWFALARAEEENYDYFAALSDYSRAVALDPADASYGMAYQSLKERIASAVPASDR
jgi:tetratricopeptide (TPR) repeat protein